MGVKIKRIDKEIEERIENINFFQPVRTLDEANSLVKKVDKIIDNHINDLRPWKKEDIPWQSTYHMALKKALYFIYNRGRVKLWNKVREEVKNKTYHEARNAVCNVVGIEGYIKASVIPWVVAKSIEDYVTWEMVRDLPQFENNPVEHYIMLYEMGLYPKGFRRVSGEERFIVDFPLVIDGENILGCYANKDEEILFGHEWEDYCKNLRYLKAPRRTIGWTP